ncbi:MAG: hypothetical protein LQ350_006712 [Teloschistes chrysophthalmus]|nr:MAG: hypothetical protein LQ350_006712 [Niorma chrysophthalma]
MTAPLPPLLLSQSSTTTTTTTAASKSTHLQDPLLLPFLAPSFSPTAYLNTSLPRPPPPRSTTTTTPQPTTKPSPTQNQQQQQPQSNSLTTITHQTTTHLSALSAQTSRLSTILTGLTDEILRRSARLGYEIEILQNQAEELVSALSLPLSSTSLPNHHTHNNGDHALEDSLRVFLPPQPPPETTSPDANNANPPPPPTPNRNTEEDDGPMKGLRTLQHTRTALQRLKELFSLAMQWEMPPSLLLSSSSSSLSTNPLASLATVTSPQTIDAEKRGLSSLSRIRLEIEELLDFDSDSGAGRVGRMKGDGKGNRGEGGKGEGVKRARARVAELRACVGVWRGTSEENARGRWVEDLGMWVEEEVRRRGLNVGKEGEIGGVEGVGGGGRGGAGVEEGGGGKTGTGTGFLQRLREEIYME